VKTKRRNSGERRKGGRDEGRGSQASSIFWPWGLASYPSIALHFDRERENVIEGR
jgi:hypothetical protein